VLLLDEPTFGVDPVSRRDLWIIVHEMVARGVTAVVSTAYMDEAERFDRLALLHRGRIVALDTPAALQADLAGRLVGFRVDRVRAARDAALAVPGVMRAAAFGEWLHVTVADGEAVAGRVDAALRAAGCAVHERRPLEPSLEDVFMDRVAEADALSAGEIRA
jgi:ABC-2 type transport system ATP-binding protein